MRPDLYSLFAMTMGHIVCAGFKWNQCLFTKIITCCACVHMGAVLERDVLTKLDTSFIVEQSQTVVARTDLHLFSIEIPILNDISVPLTGSLFTDLTGLLHGL